MRSILNKWLLAALLLGLLAAAFAVPGASSQVGGQYDLSWNSVDGGGITFASGGNYMLGGTIGAADAGTMQGGAYTLGGGFWVGTAGRSIYLPLVRR
jgi:hypothetical protein